MFTFALAIASGVLPPSPVTVVAGSPAEPPLARLDKIVVAKGGFGLYLDSSGRPVVVTQRGWHLDSNDSEIGSLGVGFREQISATTPAVVAQIKRELLEFRERLPANYGYAYYFSLEKDRVLVQTNAPASVFNEFGDRFGPLIEIQAGAVGGAAWDRNYDAPYYWGGDALTDGSGKCSGGYAAKDGYGSVLFVTAGHCFAQGALVWANPDYKTTGNLVGRVTTRNFPFIDAELIGLASQYQGVIYNGVAGNTTSSIQVRGYKTPIRGEGGYCRTGIVTGLKCDWRIGDTTATFCWQPFNCTGDELAFDGTPPIPGDSGGPIYYPYNGGALITGSITGFWSLPTGTISYGAKASRVLGDWHLTLVCETIACVTR